MNPTDDAVDDVVEASARDLFAYFARRVARREDAEDLLADTLAVVWQQRDRMPTKPEPARMWAFGIARNMLRRHRRTSSRWMRLLHAETMHSTHAGRDLDPADLAEQRGTAREIHHALATLREADRELIRLVHWDGFTIVDAAQLLEMNASTARTRYARALQTLRRELDRAAGRREGVPTTAQRPSLRIRGSATPKGLFVGDRGAG